MIDVARSTTHVRTTLATNKVANIFCKWKNTQHRHLTRYAAVFKQVTRFLLPVLQYLYSTSRNLKKIFIPACHVGENNLVQTTAGTQR